MSIRWVCQEAFGDYTEAPRTDWFGQSHEPQASPQIPGLSGLPAPASDLGLIKFNIPGIELDENVENAIGGLGVLVAAGVGLYGLYFVAPVLGLIVGDTRKAFRKF